MKPGDTTVNDNILDSRLEGTTLVVETDAGKTCYDSRFLVAALLLFVARGSGDIAPEEAGKMIELIGNHFHMEGAESLELLTYAMSEMAEKAALEKLLVDLGPTLSAVNEWSSKCCCQVDNPVIKKVFQRLTVISSAAGQA